MCHRHHTIYIIYNHIYKVHKQNLQNKTNTKGLNLINNSDSL